MIYPQNFEQKTGFDKVRALVCDKCLSPLGEELAGDMSFSGEYSLIKRRLNLVDEFINILKGEREFPVSYFFDARHSLRRIRPEGTFMDEKELFDLKRSLQTISEIVRFLEKPLDEKPQYPALSELADGVGTFPATVTMIEGILDKFGRIKDNASPALATIRRDIISTTSSISRSLQSILRSAQAEGVVDKDVAPTMRDGRLMIPVAPTFKRKIRGIVHDESSSGKTVFIEPEAVVEANNRIRELEADERREIVRILTEVTDRIRPQAQDILFSYGFMAEIDFVRAKALFAKQVNAICPDIDNRPQLDFIRAIHPLLYLSQQAQGKETVPLDIQLTDEQRILLISGPNAGGKSVCLKTVGLLQYMLQCGMPVPVYERSRAGVFSGIFIDIGDEQSIENDLSTYSSHLINMKFFDRNCNSKTLLLIDEFGSGTEPQIGGAIAESLLQRFNAKKGFGVITTHYQNLKHIAGQTPGIINGAMLYDRQLMKPLFKLSTGHAGSSFAIEIARKTGLAEEVIAAASEKVGADYVNMDKYLQDIVRDKRYWETKRENIRKQEKKLDELTSTYENNLENLDRQRKEIMREAKEKASLLLGEANARIESVIREIKENQADREKTKRARKELEGFKATISEADSDEIITRQMEKLKKRQENKKNRKKTQPAFDKDNIRVGDNVRLQGQKSAGTVIELQDKEATVAFGSIKSIVKLSKLEKVSKGQIKSQEKQSFVSSQTSDNIREKKLNFKQELDIRGMRGDEALQAVAYFVDDAILVGISPVRILHGTGSGILRQLVRDYLQTTSGISRFHDEHIQFGGAGITVVELE